MLDKLRKVLGLPQGATDRWREQAIRMLMRAETFIVKLITKNKEYNESWKKRGGVGAYMMLARKWDRIEEQVKRHGWDIFAAMAADKRDEGLIDDIKDLIGYLLLVEDEVTEQVDITHLDSTAVEKVDAGTDPGRTYVSPDTGYLIGQRVEVRVDSHDPAIQASWLSGDLVAANGDWFHVELDNDGLSMRDIVRIARQDVPHRIRKISP